MSVPAPPTEQPVLPTTRLVLRPYTLADAPALLPIVSERDVAVTTLTIPHPYPPNGAAEWIATHQPKWNDGTAGVWAITLREDGALKGSIGLRINREHAHAELGYVIAKGQWNRGYATEAAGAVLHYAMGELGLQRVFAHHMTNNPASGAIMRKLGMRYEGTMRGHILKWGERRDIALYGITREEYDRR